MPHTTAMMIHPGSHPEWDGGDGKTVPAIQTSLDAQHIPEPIITHKGFGRELPSLLSSLTSSWVRIAGNHLQGICYPFLVSESSQLLRTSPSRALRLCINCRLCSVICYDWTHHCVRCVTMCPEAPSHPFPSRMTCTQVLSQSTVDTLIHHHEIRIYGGAPVGKQSWDQTKHSIKPCRLKCLYPNSHTNHTYLQRIIVASKLQVTKWAVTGWMWNMKKKKSLKEKKPGKNLVASCNKCVWSCFEQSLPVWGEIVSGFLRWLALFWPCGGSTPWKNEARRNNFIFIIPKTCTRWFILTATNS